MKLKLTVFTFILFLLPLSLDAKTPRKRTAARRTTTVQAAPAISGWATKWKEKAEAGDPEAQYELAFCYYWPIGVKQDNAKAMEWAKKSSEQGFPLGSELIGRMYYFGNGVSKDEYVADVYFKRALEQATPLAEAGDPHAQYALYFLYNYGRGVDKDVQQALKWLRPSAEKGYNSAQNSLGWHYDKGEGVTQDYSEAVKWCRLAAEQGNPWAQNNLGVCYFNGNGVSENKAEAVKWYQKGANQGYPSSQYNLGYCYAYGKGVAKNASLGRQWLKKAADNGNKDAKKELAKMEAQPEPERTEPERTEPERKTFTVNGVTFTMIKVEHGKFTMGPHGEHSPAHRVTLTKDYWIGETEVTQDLWKAVVGAPQSIEPGYPMTNVSWESCQSFIRRLNSITGENFRLPTEAEWEFAARGGNLSKGYKYSGSNKLGSVGWYKDNCPEVWPLARKTVCRVKRKSPNELGVYDMSGNVWEWCQDWFGDYSSDSQVDPKGSTSYRDRKQRVTRGGSFESPAKECRVTWRSSMLPDGWHRWTGFRLAM